MKIKIDEESYFATVDTLFLAMQGECMTRCVFVEHPTVKGTTDYFLRVEMPDMMVYDLQIVNSQVILTNTITAYAATIPLQWIAKDNTGAIIAKSQIIDAIVKDSIDGDASALPTPEEMQTKYQEYISAMAAIRDEVDALKKQIEEGTHQEMTAIKEEIDTIKAEMPKNISYVNIYVSSDGNDENDGATAETAVKTLDRAIQLSRNYKSANVHLASGQTFTASETVESVGAGLIIMDSHIYFYTFGNGTNPVIDSPVAIMSSIVSFFGVNFPNDIVNVNLSNVTIKNCQIAMLQAERTICSLENSTLQEASFDFSNISMAGCNVTRATADHCSTVHTDNSTTISGKTTDNGGVFYKSGIIET